MKVEKVSPVVPPGGLSALDEVVLRPGLQRVLDAAVASCGGPAVWRARKQAEARDLLALSQMTPRFAVQQLDLREALRALAVMRVPVPRHPDASGALCVGSRAVLGIRYVFEALRTPQPGYAFVQILAPGDVWHANVVPDPAQALCLGTHLPAAIPLKEIVLMTYGALSMQTVMIDELDAAGVFNGEAARWWQANQDKIPLTRAPFLSSVDAQ